MRSRAIRELAAGAVIAACLAATATSAAGATSYYVGHGDDHNARVSFKVKRGEVRSAILELRRMPLKQSNGRTTRINVIQAIARAPHVPGSDSGFQGIIRHKSDRRGGPDLRFGFSGHLWSSRDPSGTTSLKVDDDYLGFNTGKIRWDASAVPKQRFKEFRGVAAMLTRDR